MNKIFYAIGTFAAALTLLASCDEWEPVFTGDYGKADVYKPVTLTPNKTIMELKSLYKNAPVKIEDGIIIGGQVISEDRSGNIYKSIYIQDATGAIEVKVGKNSLYNDYKLGQWVYVKCSGLTLGDYKGMIQLGYEDASGEYQTSYLDVQYIIDTHIFRGELDTPLAPKKVAESDLLKEENLGCYVEIGGLKYGSVKNPKGEIFCIIYVDSSKDKKSDSNRIFLSSTSKDKDNKPVKDPSWGIKTWAMSKQGFISYLNSGVLDAGMLNDKSKPISDPELKSALIKNADAYAVSQYFRMGSTDVQVRTSGYAKFADAQIDQKILNGAEVNLRGILTKFDGKTQFTLIDLNGVEITTK